MLITCAIPLVKVLGGILTPSTGIYAYVRYPWTSYLHWNHDLRVNELQDQIQGRASRTKRNFPKSPFKMIMSGCAQAFTVYNRFLNIEMKTQDIYWVTQQSISFLWIWPVSWVLVLGIFDNHCYLAICVNCLNCIAFRSIVVCVWVIPRGQGCCSQELLLYLIVLQRI